VETENSYAKESVSDLGKIIASTFAVTFPGSSSRLIALGSGITQARHWFYLAGIFGITRISGDHEENDPREVVRQVRRISTGRMVFRPAQRKGKP
jgi:hypothetical protein